RPRVFIFLAAAALVVGGGVYWRHRSGGPQVPVIALEGVDREVAAAIQEAQDAVQRSPRSGEAWGRLGWCLVSHDYLAEGNFCLARAEELSPRDPRWPYLQAMMMRWTNPATIPK